MHTLNIVSLNVNGLNSAVKQTRLLEYLHRKSISCALIQETYLICRTGLRHLLFGYLFVTLHHQGLFFICFGSVLLSLIYGHMWAWFCPPCCKLVALLAQFCVFLMVFLVSL